MTKIIGFAALLALFGQGSAFAGDYPFLDELTRYAERIDTLSVASGDAQSANVALQVIDPWPPYARDRRIPADGKRMVGAVNRYQNAKSGQALAPVLLPGVPGIGTGQ